MLLNVVLEKTLESPLDSKEIQPVHPKGNQSWIFIGRTDAEAETQILWPPDVKKWLIWKDPDAGKDWQFFTSGGQSIGASALASVLPTNSQGWFPLGLTGLISLQSKGLSRVFFSTTVQKHQFFSAQLSLWSNPPLTFKKKCFAEPHWGVQAFWVLVVLNYLCGNLNAALSFTTTWWNCISDWHWTSHARTWTQPNPDWDLNPQPFNWDHTWSQDLLNLRLLMSHLRKNSGRNKVIGKKLIYLEKNTLHRQSVG